MMNEQERSAARLGIEALNAALVALGYLPMGSNSHVRLADPVVGDIPNAVVEKPGAPPWRLVFGRDLDIWVGPYSGIVEAPLLEDARKDIEELIIRILRSEVICRYGRRSIELTFRLHDQVPWLRLKVRGAGRSSPLEPRYSAFASR